MKQKETTWSTIGDTEIGGKTLTNLTGSDITLGTTTKIYVLVDTSGNLSLTATEPSSSATKV